MIAKSALFQLAKTLDGLPVLGCLQGTPAADAGVRYGDVVLSVNGERTRSFDDFMAAKALRLDGMHVVLFRDGEEVSFELTYRTNRPAVSTPSLLAELIAMRVLSGPAQGGESPAS